MMRTATVSIALGLLFTTAACRKQTPVSEVSVSSSGVSVTDSSVPFAADDWAQWRGNLSDGIAVDQIVPTKWGESDGVRWKVDVPGRGHSSPIVVGETIILGTADDAAERQVVIAFDRSDGREVWRTTIHEGGFPARRKIHNKASNANGTLAFDGERFFTAFLNSDQVFVSALDREGKALWQKSIGAFDSKFGYAPSPVLYKSLVIAAADNQGGGYIAALDRSTGKIAWRVARGDASSYSSPMVANLGGRDQMLISGGDRVVSYDPASGKQLWATECITSATCGTVVVHGDRLFASGGHPDKETVCLSHEGKIFWSNSTKVYEPSMIAHEGHLFAISDDGIANCWSTKDGDQAWRERLGGNFSSSPVIAGGNIYVGNLSGECHVFKATGDAFQRIATNRLGTDMYASPAFSRGEIFLRVGTGDGGNRQEQLVCIAALEPVPTID